MWLWSNDKPLCAPVPVPLRSSRETEKMTGIQCLAQGLAYIAQQMVLVIYALCVMPRMQGAQQKLFPFSNGEAQGCAREGRLVGHTLRGPAGKCCLQLRAVVFWAGPCRLQRISPSFWKGSICSSLALWQRPPTKANKRSGLASTDPQRPLQLFGEKFASPRLAQEERLGVEHNALST